MDTPFVYDKYVTGKSFIGRKKECGILGNLLSAGENVVLIEPQKSGKMSLIQQTLLNIRSAGGQFVIADAGLFNVRTLNEFLIRFGSSVLKAFYTTPEQYKGAVEKHLEGTHFIFDRERFYQKGDIISLNWSVDNNDIEAVLRMPYLLSIEHNTPFYVLIREFQMIMNAEEYEDVFKAMETVFSEKHEGASVSYVMMGSQVNAMKYIFSYKKYFYRQVVHLPVQPIDEKEIAEHVVRGFLYSQGKSFDRNLALGASELFKGNMWYINHLAAICDSMSKGFINEGIMVEALRSMISLHEPRFMNMINDLTDFQLYLLKAVLDGVVKFSSSEVIEKYHLNSSANVRRVKDALCKKEIITFNEREEPVILDPLFEYWLVNYYFI